MKYSEVKGMDNRPTWKKVEKSQASKAKPIEVVVQPTPDADAAEHQVSTETALVPTDFVVNHASLLLNMQG